MKKLTNKKGFTLTELIVVIVIIGILAAVLIPSLTQYINKAKQSAAEQDAIALVTEYVATLENEDIPYATAKTFKVSVNGKTVWVKNGVVIEVSLYESGDLKGQPSGDFSYYTLSKANNVFTCQFVEFVAATTGASPVAKHYNAATSTLPAWN